MCQGEFFSGSVVVVGAGVAAAAPAARASNQVFSVVLSRRLSAGSSSLEHRASTVLITESMFTSLDQNSSLVSMGESHLIWLLEGPCDGVVLTGDGADGMVGLMSSSTMHSAPSPSSSSLSLSSLDSS